MKQGRKNMTDNDTRQHKRFTIRIGESLYKRISKHILLLKRLKSNIRTKQDWVEKAVRDKLERENNSDATEEVPTDKFIHFKIDKQLNLAIDKRVNFIRQFKVSYSRKQWIVEAIFDQLDQEEHSSKEIFNLMLKRSEEKTSKYSKK